MAHHFVYSALVLQHLPRVEAIRTFIAEFLRVLKPGGLLAFQLPTRMPPRTLRTILRLRTRAYAAYLRLLGAAVLAVQGGRFEVGEVESATYIVTKSNGR
jgi:ubiquinone/menaquinone biosynthesis C-methylase UbiE